MRRGLRFIVLIREDLKVLPFADEITKQRFLLIYFKILNVDPARVGTRDLPHDSPVLNQLIYVSP